MPRTLTLEDIAEVKEWKFIKIEFPAPYGTLRFTDRPEGYTGNIDGSVQTWVEIDFEDGGFSLSNQDPLIVNWIQFANLDSYWSTLAQTLKIRDTPITVYQAIFNVDTGSLADKYVEYIGTLDEGEYKEVARFTLKPFHSSWGTLVLYNKLAGLCINDFMNPEDCQYPYTPGLSCAKTRAACRAYSNELHINIYDDMPKPNEQLIYAGKRVNLVSKDQA